jgi:hypothetical protein
MEQSKRVSVGIVQIVAEWAMLCIPKSVQPGPGAHPVFCAAGPGFLFQGVKPFYCKGMHEKTESCDVNMQFCRMHGEFNSGAKGLKYKEEGCTWTGP